MTPTAGAAIDIARLIRQRNPRAKIILGGAHGTLLPEATLKKAPEIDIIVRGEGEFTILELLAALENGTPVADIPGINYRGDGELCATPDRALVDMDSLPFLAYHKLPLKAYRPHLESRFTVVLLSWLQICLGGEAEAFRFRELKSNGRIKAFGWHRFTATLEVAFLQ